MTARIDIRAGTSAEAYALYGHIAEFQTGAALPAAEFERRLGSPGALVLIAAIDGSDVGFKAGYDRYHDGSWYSWLGGVVTGARRMGVAQTLLTAQEAAIAARGYRCIYVKTRNRFAAMRILLVQAGYDVVAVTPARNGAPRRQDLRLVHVKYLGEANAAGTTA
jgi:ribosomal protein S18 acetylase RimI-like enzyme